VKGNAWRSLHRHPGDTVRLSYESRHCQFFLSCGYVHMSRWRQTQESWCGGGLAKRRHRLGATVTSRQCIKNRWYANSTALRSAGTVIAGEINTRESGRWISATQGDRKELRLVSLMVYFEQCPFPSRWRKF